MPQLTASTVRRSMARRARSSAGVEWVRRAMALSRWAGDCRISRATNYRANPRMRPGQSCARGSALCGGAPIAVETQGHVMRQLGEGDRALLERHRIEDGELAAPLRPAIDGGEEIPFALRRLGAGRCEDRFRKGVTRRHAVGPLQVGLEVAMDERVERADRRFSALGREVAVAIGMEREAVVETREVAGEVVDALAFDAVGRRPALRSDAA